jgi:hypothetical protein
VYLEVNEQEKAVFARILRAKTALKVFHRPWLGRGVEGITPDSA